MASVSIKTVAAKAGVSFQTASKVLNGKGSVSERTRQRIVEAASQLGYVPNAVARGLVTRSTRTVGVVASDLSDDVLAQFVVGAEREARQQGHSVIISIVAIAEKSALVSDRNSGDSMNADTPGPFEPPGQARSIPRSRMAGARALLRAAD